MLVPVIKKGKTVGYRIKSHTTGKVYPKVYSNRAAGEKRIAQMEQFKHIRSN